MRQKELQCVVTFQTTTEAMAFEEAAKEAGLSGRIIPVPRAITAGCGLAWRENPRCRALLEKLLGEHHLGYDRIYELLI
jgi:hypothetical protein